MTTRIQSISLISRVLAMFILAACAMLLSVGVNAEASPPQRLDPVPASQGFKQQNGCFVWTLQPSPNGSQFDNYLYGVAALSPDDAWSVGGYVSSSGFRTLALHYAGGQWTIDSSPNVGTGGNSLRAVAALSADDIWAVGSYNSDGASHTLTMHRTNGQWDVVPSPNVSASGNNLTSIATISSSDIWAVGTYQGGTARQTLVLHYTNGQWNIVPSPNLGSGNNYLTAVTAISADDIWAVGSFTIGSTLQTLAMHYTGGQWQVVPTPNVGAELNELKAVSAVSANDVWAVGTAGTQTLTLHYTNGQWSVVPSPNPGTSNNYLNGVEAISSDNVWAVGSYITPSIGAPTLILHYTNGQWSIVPSPSATTNYNDLKAVDGASSGDLWAVGYFAHPSSLEKTEILHYPDPCTGPTATPSNTVVLPSSTPTRTPTRTSTSTRTSTPTATRTTAPTQTPGGPTATPEPTHTPTPTSTPCTLTFIDVPEDNVFYPFIRCLACRGIISGYSDGTFRPNADISRGQIAKIVSNSAGFTEDAGEQIYEDVASDNPFYSWINRLSRRGYMGGYACGGPFEPCGTGNRPYFRPFANATRGQLAKIVSNAAGFSDTPVGTIYTDVPPENPFYLWIMRLSIRGVMGGYLCGGPGEPCDDQNRPYFRPFNTVTRGQASKIVSNTFFLDCETPYALFGLTSPNTLVRFNSNTPGVLLRSVDITGLQVGEEVLGIDFRPANGQLYALGNSNRLYTLDVLTGAATTVSSTTFITPLVGADFGFDFNPTVDRIRVVSDADQNLRLNPTTGGVAAQDGTLQYAAGDPNFGQDPNVTGAGYTNSFSGATATTLYGIDTNLDVLVIQNPPNNGTLNTVGPLGGPFAGDAGFDIEPFSNTAYATLIYEGFTTSRLYEINLSNGSASLVDVLEEADTMRDIAFAPEGTP